MVDGRGKEMRWGDIVSFYMPSHNRALEGEIMPDSNDPERCLVRVSGVGLCTLALNNVIRICSPRPYALASRLRDLTNDERLEFLSLFCPNCGRERVLRICCPCQH